MDAVSLGCYKPHHIPITSQSSGVIAQRNSVGIPHKVHLIWCGKKMPDYALHTVQRFSSKAKRRVAPYSVNLWLDKKSQYENARALHSEYVDMERVGTLKLRYLEELNLKVGEEYSEKDAELYHQFTSREGVGIECQAARADIYRLEILRQEGGIYSDMDADFYPWVELTERFSCDESAKKSYLEHYFRRKIGLSSPPKPFHSWPSFFQKISESPEDCKRLTGKDDYKALTREVIDYIILQSSKELDGLEAKSGILFKPSDLYPSRRWLINNNLIGATPNHEFIKRALQKILKKYEQADSITRRIPYNGKTSADDMDMKRSNSVHVLYYSGPEHLSCLLKEYGKDESLAVQELTFNEDSSYIAMKKGRGIIDGVTFAGIRISERSYENTNKPHGARSWDKKPSKKSFEL